MAPMGNILGYIWCSKRLQNPGGMGEILITGALQRVNTALDIHTTLCKVTSRHLRNTVQVIALRGLGQNRQNILTGGTIGTETEFLRSKGWVEVDDVLPYHRHTSPTCSRAEGRKFDPISAGGGNRKWPARQPRLYFCSLGVLPGRSTTLHLCHIIHRTRAPRPAAVSATYTSNCTDRGRSGNPAIADRRGCHTRMMPPLVYCRIGSKYLLAGQLSHSGAGGSILSESLLVSLCASDTTVTHPVVYST